MKKMYEKGYEAEVRKVRAWLLFLNIIAFILMFSCAILCIAIKAGNIGFTWAFWPAVCMGFVCIGFALWNVHGTSGRTKLRDRVEMLHELAGSESKLRDITANPSHNTDSNTVLYIVHNKTSDGILLQVIFSGVHYKVILRNYDGHGISLMLAGKLFEADGIPRELGGLDLRTAVMKIGDEVEKDLEWETVITPATNPEPEIKLVENGSVNLDPTASVIHSKVAQKSMWFSILACTGWILAMLYDMWISDVKWPWSDEFHFFISIFVTISFALTAIFSWSKKDTGKYWSGLGILVVIIMVGSFFYWSFQL